MRIITYLGFTLLSILIQFSVMDFIQSIMQLDDKLIDTSNATSQKRKLRDVIGDLKYRPHALYYQTPMNKLGKGKAPAKIYDNTSLPDLLSATEATTTAVFEVLYDESTSVTDEDASFTTEAFYTSTEFDNVTDITIFGKTNQTNAQPNVKPKKDNNKNCKCNFLHGVCDINCCCDVECTEDEKKMFPNCTKIETANQHDDVCYSHLFYFGQEGPVTSFLNNWFCIVKINLPKKQVQNKQSLLQTDNVFFTWKDIEKPKRLYEFTNKIYDYGDPIWLIKNGSIYYIDLPSPLMNSYCTRRKTIQFLKNYKMSCHVKIGDLELFQIMKSSEEGSVISATPLSINSTMLNCSNLHCVNWTLIICENLICTNYNKSIHEPECNESMCTNLALRIQYIFNYYDSKITNATIKFHIQNIPVNLHFMTQQIEVKFVLINESIDRLLKLSGNPGYIEDKPVIVSYTDSNYTDAFYNNTSNNQTYFSIPENRDGICIASNLTDNYVLFGTNKRIKCRYYHKYSKPLNSTEQCIDIQNNLHRLLQLKNRTVVSPLGDPRNLKDNDWIPMEWKIKENTLIYGEQEKSSKLHCYNIITRYSFVFRYAKIEDNTRIIGIKLDTTSRNKSFNFDDLSMVVTFDVNFIDATKPSVIEYASSPNLHLFLPNDLFLPFPSNKSQVVSINVFCIIFYLCIAILSCK